MLEILTSLLFAQNPTPDNFVTPSGNIFCALVGDKKIIYDVKSVLFSLHFLPNPTKVIANLIGEQDYYYQSMVKQKFSVLVILLLAAKMFLPMVKLGQKTGFNVLLNPKV
jgi:hypothetical protein